MITQGPWIYAGPIGFGHYIIADGGPVAVAYGGSKNPDGFGNALLIAAAPSMLGLVLDLLNDAVLSEGQVSKLLSMGRVEVRSLADAWRRTGSGPEPREALASANEI